MHKWESPCSDYLKKKITINKNVSVVPQSFRVDWVSSQTKTKDFLRLAASEVVHLLNAGRRFNDSLAAWQCYRWVLSLKDISAPAKRADVFSSTRKKCNVPRPPFWASTLSFAICLIQLAFLDPLQQLGCQAITKVCPGDGKKKKCWDARKVYLRCFRHV